MAAVTLQHVVKIYPQRFKAVDDFCLEVADGELLVLVGPSGCGKTTTLRMIAGLEEVTGGTISIGGQLANHVPPQDRDVAMVFQNDALYPHLSVYGNLAFSLKLRHTARGEIRRRVGQVAAVLGLEELLARRPWELSGGQRRRVALGRTLVRRPKVFLLDEPLSNLDAGLRSRIRRQLRQIHDQLGTTMIYVTHDQIEAMTLGDRLVVVRAGRIQQAADPATLYQRPANRFVAELIGSPPMNFFAGRLERRDDRLVFQEGSFALPIPAPWKDRLQARTGQAITLGLRPEHVGSAAAEQINGAPRIPATLEAVEPVGAELYLYLSTPNHQFISRADLQRRCCVGERLELAVAAGNLYFFDPETGQAVY